MPTLDCLPITAIDQFLEKDCVRINDLLSHRIDPPNTNEIIFDSRPIFKAVPISVFKDAYRTSIAEIADKVNFLRSCGASIVCKSVHMIHSEQDGFVYANTFIIRATFTRSKDELPENHYQVS